jgi:hypothetical protein
LREGKGSVLSDAFKKHKHYITSKPVGKPTILTKQPKHTLQFLVTVESDSSLSEDSDSKIASIWADNKGAGIAQ